MALSINTVSLLASLGDETAQRYLAFLKGGNFYFSSHKDLYWSWI